MSKDRVRLGRKIQMESEAIVEDSLFSEDLIPAQAMADAADARIRVLGIQKSPIYLLVAIHSDGFPLSPGDRVTAWAKNPELIADAVIDEAAMLTDASGKVHRSLSRFAQAMMRSERRKPDGSVFWPDGWNSCYVLVDGKHVTIDDLFLDNWETLGIPIAELEDEGQVAKEAVKRGILKPDNVGAYLRSKRTRQIKT